MWTKQKNVSDVKNIQRIVQEHTTAITLPLFRISSWSNAFCCHSNYITETKSVHTWDEMRIVLRKRSRVEVSDRERVGRREKKSSHKMANINVHFTFRFTMFMVMWWCEQEFVSSLSVCFILWYSESLYALAFSLPPGSVCNGRCVLWMWPQMKPNVFCMTHIFSRFCTALCCHCVVGFSTTLKRISWMWMILRNLYILRHSSLFLFFALYTICFL